MKKLDSVNSQELYTRVSTLESRLLIIEQVQAARTEMNFILKLRD